MLRIGQKKKGLCGWSAAWLHSTNSMKLTSCSMLSTPCAKSWGAPCTSSVSRAARNSFFLFVSGCMLCILCGGSLGLASTSRASKAVRILFILFCLVVLDTERERKREKCCLSYVQEGEGLPLYQVDPELCVIPFYFVCLLFLARCCLFHV